MFKRLTWLGVGLVAGAAASKWVEIKARRRLARYFPAGSSALKAAPDVASRARDVAVDRAADLRYALEGGRSAMALRESELRRQLGLPEPGERSAGSPSGPGRAVNCAAQGRAHGLLGRSTAAVSPTGPGGGRIHGLHSGHMPANQPCVCPPRRGRLVYRRFTPTCNLFR